MSADSLLNRYKEIHESYMKQILFAIFQGPYKDILAFKGGTLAYLHYGLTRFSTDLDIDLLDLSKEQAVIDFFDELLISMGETEKRVGKALHRRKFRYDPQGWMIKIELNKRQSPFSTYEMIVIDGVKIQVQDLKSMTSNKLLALGNRRYNRDLYDIHFFLTQGYHFQESIIQDREGQSLQSWIEMLIHTIPDQFAENTILHQLGEVLDDTQKPRVKNHLAEETIKLLQLYLATH